MLVHLSLAFKYGSFLSCTLLVCPEGLLLLTCSFLSVSPQYFHSHSRTRFLMKTSLIASLYVIVKQEFRKDWLSILMIVTSARSSINIRHLEKATVSTGKEGFLSEGNAAYNWSRYSPTFIWHCDWYLLSVFRMFSL